MLELLSQKTLTKEELFNSKNWEYLHAIQVETVKVFLIAWHSSLIAFLVKASCPIPMAKAHRRHVSPQTWPVRNPGGDQQG